jgi:pimeloyl-ACP methyl ester carboxylesterase
LVKPDYLNSYCTLFFPLPSSLNGTARLEIIKKTGHAPQLEDPARFNKTMLDFLLAAQKPDDPSNSQ